MQKINVVGVVVVRSMLEIEILIWLDLKSTIKIIRKDIERRKLYAGLRSMVGTMSGSVIPIYMREIIGLVGYAGYLLTGS